MVSSLSDMMHFSSFCSLIFEKHVKRCGDCREIVKCGVELSVVQKGFEKGYGRVEDFI